MKVWVVSHAYVTPVSHDKLLALAALDDVDLTLLVPDSRRTATGMLRLLRLNTPDPIVVAWIARSGRIGAYRYRALGALRRARPDIVHAEVEPWSLAALQLVRAAGPAPVVLFTWENLEGPRRLASRAIDRFVLRRMAHVIAGNHGARGRRGDAVALRAQIAALLDDAALRKRLVARGRARVERLYTNDHVAHAQREIYRSLLVERAR